MNDSQRKGKQEDEHNPMKAIVWILGLAALWGVTGAVAGWGLQTFFGAEGWILSCGSLNVAFGMALLQLITQNEQARAMFYEGEKPDEDYFNPGLAFLWGLPILLAVSGILWWLASKLLIW